MITVRDDFARGIRTIEIDNPKRGNALDAAAVVDLASAFRDVDALNFNAVVLKGASTSKHFCSGIDLKAASEVFAMDEGDVENDPVSMMERCEALIVCVARGDCVNAGFELALACDAVVCSEDARFVDSHGTIGILPSWGLSVKLSRVIGANAARHVSAFGVPLDAKRAYDLGLACVVTKDGASAEREAERLAERVCAMPKGAASALKRAINDGLDLKTVREEERRRAFESYRKYAREKFAAFNSRRTKSKL